MNVNDILVLNEFAFDDQEQKKNKVKTYKKVRNIQSIIWQIWSILIETDRFDQSFQQRMGKSNRKVDDV